EAFLHGLYSFLCDGFLHKAIHADSFPGGHIPRRPIDTVRQANGERMVHLVAPPVTPQDDTIYGPVAFRPPAAPSPSPPPLPAARAASRGRGAGRPRPCRPPAIWRRRSPGRGYR